ncbi:type II toxin-antitoxin system PemK/MazF family toxin [Rhodopirellula bahusiensis]
MAIKYYPSRGEILFCDFEQGGFVKPEMVKNRPVVVVSRRTGGQTCTVVPISGTEPEQNKPWHVLLSDGALPGAWATRTLWAKCDMVTSVGYFRLDRLKTRVNGKRVWQSKQMNRKDLDAVIIGIRSALAIE